jgi:hypothetical protein
VSTLLAWLAAYLALSLVATLAFVVAAHRWSKRNG